MSRTLAEREGKRAPLSLRTTHALRERLVAVSTRADRSLTQEVEHRLERSFDHDDLRALIREELRAELRAELRSEIRAALAETAEERTKGYLRAAIDRDPNVKAALHRQSDLAMLGDIAAARRQAADQGGIACTVDQSGKLRRIG